MLPQGTSVKLVRHHSSRKRNRSAAVPCNSAQPAFCAMTDFPTPTSPYSQSIRSPSFSLATQLIWRSKTATRVFSWHRGRSTSCPEVWIADGTTCCKSPSNPPTPIEISSCQQDDLFGEREQLPLMWVS